MTDYLSAGRQLESKLQEAKNKKDTLKARAKSANSAKQINEMVQGLNVNNAMTAFERMEEKVMALESESQATAQVRPQPCMREPRPHTCTRVPLHQLQSQCCYCCICACPGAGAAADATAH